MKKYKQTVIPQADNLWDNLDQATLKKAAQKYYEDNLLGKSVVNQHKKVAILFTKSGIKHVLNYGQREYIKFKGVKILPKLIELAEFKNFKNADLDDADNVVGYMNFEVKANIEGKIYKLRLVVRITNDGKFYYHHAKKIR